MSWLLVTATGVILGLVFAALTTLVTGDTRPWRDRIVSWPTAWIVLMWTLLCLANWAVQP